MINHYEIKKINNEEVLFVYLNISEEFSLDFKRNHKYKGIKKPIKQIIDSENLWGKKIILVVGGIIIGSLLFFGNPADDNNIDDYVFVDSNIVSYTDMENLNINNKDEDNVKEEVNHIEENESIKEEIIEPEKESTINQNINNDSINENTTVNINTNTTQNNNQSQNPPNEIIIPEKEVIKVTVHRSNGSIITLSINDYLIGVIGAEMPASFSIEALKAQAILARTYAMKKIEKNEKLTDTVSTQSYKDNDQLKSLWNNEYSKYYSKIKQAVEETDGITLKYNGEYIEAVYHSTSNGKTEDSKNVWKNSFPYLISVDSSWDLNTTPYLRTVNKDLNSVLTTLGVNYENINFEIISRNASGRVENIKVGDHIFTGIEFRNLLGLRSADFDVSIVGNEVVITTRGYGHGVGMSQYGANKMAEAGNNYSQILNHYYPGTYLDN